MSLNKRSTLILTIVLAIFSQLGCVGQTATEEDYRSFTDRRGRTVEARIVQAQDDHVTIERRDGKQFRVLVSELSQADQAFVRERLQVGGDEAGQSSPSHADWPCFRGPGGMGVSQAKGLPLEWGDGKNVLWKRELPGSGASSPITFGDRIYLTAYSGYFVPGESGGSQDQLRRHLIALDRASGEILWDQSVPAKLPEEEQIRDHGFAANTPAADADHVYAFFGKTGVIAFDHSGRQVWRSDVGSNTHGWGTASSPLLFDDLVIVNASVESESLIALDRMTGEEKWRAPEIREAWNTPIIVTSEAGSKELVLARHGDVLAFDPASGDPLWSCKTDITWYMVPTGVAANGVVYFLGGRSGTASLAVRTGGRGDVTATHRLWTTKNGSNVTSPIYFDDHLYWMSHDGGIAYCAKAESGELVYEQRLGRFGQVYASPVLADGRLYYFSRDGRAAVLAATPEFKQLAANRLDDRSRFDASPAVDGNRILIRSEKFLYCLAE
ncbi:MAG: PQQ-binding-like beta-propeller repeat protein [Pirellulaceae bacterium]